MYLQTRRGSTEYRQTAGQKRARGLRSEYLPCRCDHTHSGQDDEVLQKSEIDYEMATEEPSKLYPTKLTRQTPSYHEMKQRKKLGIQFPNQVSILNGVLH